MPKKNIKSRKSKNSKKHSKKNKTTKRKNKRSARKGTRKFSKRIRGGDLPSNQRPQRPNDEMFIDREEIQGNVQDVGQEINGLILEILDLGLIEQNTRPEFVYNVMVRMLELWNYAVELHREGLLTEDDFNHMRVITDSIYDGVVRVTPQEGAFIVNQEEEEPLSEIINIRSSAILSDLFDYVANINSNNQDTRINDTVEIPDYETTYGQIPDEDNPDFETDDGSSNGDDMDVSQ